MRKMMDFATQERAPTMGSAPYFPRRSHTVLQEDTDLQIPVNSAFTTCSLCKEHSPHAPSCSRLKSEVTYTTRAARHSTSSSAQKQRDAHMLSVLVYRL